MKSDDQSFSTFSTPIVGSVFLNDGDRASPLGSRGTRCTFSYTKAGLLECLDWLTSRGQAGSRDDDVLEREDDRLTKTLRISDPSQKPNALGIGRISMSTLSFSDRLSNAFGWRCPNTVSSAPPAVCGRQ
jgi:hypothetical protein